MKAFLLAAGKGTRLGEITKTTPKCLLKVKGKPILQFWLENLARAGVQEVLINTHYLHEQVESFISQWKGAPKIKGVYEPELLGSAGTLIKNQDFVVGEDGFIVCYADNWTDFELSELVRKYQENKNARPLAIMALHVTDVPERCGIAALDDAGWIKSFVEKPKNPTSNLANSGIYYFSRESIGFLPQKLPADIAFDFLHRLLPRMLGLKLDVPLIDIGTPESYEKVNRS